MADDLRTFKLDASGNGCSGMFWRSSTDMGASVSASDWPRNGAILKGSYVPGQDGWVKIEHEKGYFLPMEQHGKQILFEQDA